MRMRRGIIISGSVHLALILAVLLRLDLFKADEAQAIQIAEVDLMTGAEFDAAVSTAPDAPREELSEITPPEQGGSDITAPTDTEAPSPRAADTPEMAEPEPAPDVSGLRQESPTPVMPQAPASPSVAETDTGDEGVSLVRPDAVGRQNPETENRKPASTTLDKPTPPAPAPRIASRPAPKPPEEAKTADVASEEVVKSEEAEKPAEEKPAEAPKEAASEIVPEQAEAPVPEAVAPLTAQRPRGRPDTVVAAATPQEEPKQPEAPATPAAKPQPQKPAGAAPAKPAQTASTPKPTTSNAAALGPPLTAREKDGIGLAVKKNWNMGPIQGLADFKELVITVQFELDRTGEVVGKTVTPVTPASPSGSYALAFRQARIAVLKSAPFKMPAEKYGQWKTVQITFNPSKGIGY
ncbi:hypothetical protein FDP22_09960 [Paroceanicella profunda]|uniref:Energy transducer TonB n=1 Tax=Paroceanicella profunda TaxID=2579971 RepID=A0A5B8FZA9_9RHOB|nr:hypothetical protein [Paroceanicella profunda]QDL92069.1 hypothetical protein FDP22_09960 [Paroceanicella profunda]